MKKIFSHAHGVKRSLNECESVLLPAFSLIEMLMALLVASLLMSALAPVMVKKGAEKMTVLTGDAGNSVHGVKIFEYNSPECNVKDAVNNIAKCKFTPPQGVRSVSLVLQAAGGGGSGSTSGVNENCTNINTVDGNVSGCSNVETNTASGFVDILIQPGMKTMTVQLVGGGAGGASATYRTTPIAQDDCHSSSMYLGSGVTGTTNLCVYKYNTGDGPAGIPAAAGITMCTASNPASVCTATRSCWNNGITSSSCTNTNSGGYDSCRRTQCNYGGDDAICNTMAVGNTTSGDWRMPNMTEMTNFITRHATTTDGLGTNGLMLCSNEATASPHDVCSHGVSLCTGSGVNNNCHSYIYFTSTTSGTNHMMLRFSNDASVTQESYNDTWAFTTRCVTPIARSPYAGGGGSSGAYLASITIPDNILSSNANKWIRIQRGTAGSGGASVAVNTTTGNNGANGGDTCFTISNTKGGAAINTVCSGGGKAGTASNTTGIGVSGKTPTCATNIAGVSVASCTFNNGGTVSTTIGGSGGNTKFNNLENGGGASGSTSTINATNGSNYGAGGGGAGSTNTGAGKGGNGFVGYAKLSYIVQRNGAGGGGGGGGARTVITSIPVTNASTYNLSVGNGGAGGAVNAVGKNGGFSSFEYESKTIKATGGNGASIGNHDNTTPTAGLKGTGGIAQTTENMPTAVEYMDGTNGADGNVSIGGYGGMSGKKESGALGGCGGLYTDTDKNCSMSNPTNANGLNGIFLLDSLLMGSGYGQAGSGGGGGGFKDFTTYGTGGNGSNGYIYIRW